MRLRIPREFAPLFCLALIAGGCSETQLDAQDAWIRAAPNGLALGVAYFTLNNRGPDANLVAVRSSAHEAASIHMSEISQGIVRMRAQEYVNVASDSTLIFEPGGLHVMLTRPARALKIGDSVQLSLEFSDGKIVTVDATVRKGPP